MATPRFARQVRDRKNPLQAYVTLDERKQVEDRAQAAGLTLSAYLRAAATGARLPSTIDYAAFKTLAEVNAAQARLGNLLKLYLQDPKPDHQAATQLIADIRSLQVALKDAARRLAV